jgi:hypothetical protein
VSNVHNMKTPLLIAVSGANGKMFRHQASSCTTSPACKKDVVLLNYSHEDYWSGKKAERTAAWIGRGTTVIERDALKRTTAKGRSG